MKIKGVNIPIVISAGQSTSRVLCFLLDTTFEEEHEQIRVYQRGLTRTASDWKLYYMGMTEGPGLFSLGNEQHRWGHNSYFWRFVMWIRARGNTSCCSREHFLGTILG